MKTANKKKKCININDEFRLMKIAIHATNEIINIKKELNKLTAYLSFINYLAPYLFIFKKTLFNLEQFLMDFSHKNIFSIIVSLHSFIYFRKFLPVKKGEICRSI